MEEGLIDKRLESGMVAPGMYPSSTWSFSPVVALICTLVILGDLNHKSLDGQMHENVQL